MSIHTAPRLPQLPSRHHVEAMLVALLIALVGASVVMLAVSADPAGVRTPVSGPASLPSGGTGPEIERFVAEIDGLLVMSARSTAGWADMTRAVRAGTASFDDAVATFERAAGAHLAALDSAAGARAPDAATARVQGLLADALRATLAADRAWLATIDFYATEEVTEMRGAVAEADAATADAVTAQQRFLTAYRTLRAQAGQRPLAPNPF